MNKLSRAPGQVDQYQRNLEETLRTFDPSKEKILPEDLRLNVTNKSMNGIKCITVDTKILQTSNPQKDSALLPFFPDEISLPAYYIKLSAGGATYLYDTVRGTLIVSHVPHKLSDLDDERNRLRGLKKRTMKDLFGIGRN